MCVRKEDNSDHALNVVQQITKIYEYELSLKVGVFGQVSRLAL